MKRPTTTTTTTTTTTEATTTTEVTSTEAATQALITRGMFRALFTSKYVNKVHHIRSHNVCIAIKLNNILWLEPIDDIIKVMAIDSIVIKQK